ncbi:MAG: RnfABCDGE type electron transport complex subunit B [Oscillospiraceae bacterium]|jgi:Na+-translocating ferredoxin:NAD+ oxidoreductase RNF subunit RnfB|nr:RnfABCDGE type electron transport complex subunit B [Oscillospiraceae bacterium]
MKKGFIAMFTYVLPVAFFIIIGFASGIVLTVAGRVFEVKTDNTVKKLLECLPEINCGACGFPGCEQYAAAVAAENAAPNQCKPGGEKTAAQIGEVLGISVSAGEPEVAFVRCSGSSSEKYVYAGTESCVASEMYYNGKEDCRFGCVGLGDCVRACPNGALHIVDRRAVVTPVKCIACGLCVKACPQKLITLQKSSRLVNVLCGSKDAAKITKAACKSGCLGCRICEKKCPKEAITVKDNLAVINADLCDSCGKCAVACPVMCITVSGGCARKTQN